MRAMVRAMCGTKTDGEKEDIGQNGDVAIEGNMVQMAKENRGRWYGHACVEEE